MPPDPDELPALTGIRGLSAVAVLGFHMHHLLGPLPLFAAGFLGVDAFFVLSGFLLAWLANGKSRSPDWPSFLSRRLWRVLPALYVQILVLGVLVANGATWLFAWSGWAAYAPQFSLLYYIGSEPIQPVSGPWWSMPVEIGFYLLFPVIWFLLRKAAGMTLIAVVLLVWLYRFGLVATQPTAPWLPFWLNHVPGMLDLFVIGMATAMWVRRNESSMAQRSGWLMAAGIASVTAVVCWPGLSQALVRLPTAVGIHTVFGIGTALLLAGLAVSTGWLQRGLSTPPLMALGTISFSLYLWHSPIMLTVKHLADPATPMWLTQSIAIVMSLVIAAVSWWLIERPIRTWRRRRAGAPHSASSSP